MTPAAESGADDAAANEALVRRWFAGLALGPADFDGLFDALVHPDIVNHPAPPQLRRGAAHFRRIIAAVRAAAGATGGYDVVQMVAEGDLVAALTVWRGTHAAPWLGVSATGRPFATPQAHTFRIAGGRLAEHWAVRDDLSFLQQVGAR